MGRWKLRVDELDIRVARDGAIEAQKVMCQAVRTGSMDSDSFGEGGCLDSIVIFLKQYEVSEKDAQRQRQVLVSSAVALGSRLDRVLSAVPVSFGRSGFSHAGGGHGWSPGRSCWRDWQSHRWWD
jgi:hypothetical protein